MTAKCQSSDWHLFFESFKALICADVGETLAEMVEPGHYFDYTGGRIFHSHVFTQVFKVIYGAQGYRIQGPNQLV